MTRVRSVDPKTATGARREVLDQVKAAFGGVPNGIKVLAASETALSAWWAFEGALSKSTLTRQVRQQIAVLTAEFNSCGYCLAAHTAAGKAVGVSADEITSARKGVSNDPFASAVLKFAAEALNTRGNVSDADIAAARQAGITDEQFLEILAFVSISTFTNYTHRFAHTDLDFPAVA
ncbi:carboxymuconolactone decarboxylase family protein [Streptomyces sp. NPDC005708]|uniref:carboxymuconolactone decarboxylase family protein n=1 Tax=Streptomyces sp. NPDC005708 TaxID=3154564 RepID=UPI0034101804